VPSLATSCDAPAASIIVGTVCQISEAAVEDAEIQVEGLCHETKSLSDKLKPSLTPTSEIA
jgi:hypothetical protein